MGRPVYRILLNLMRICLASAHASRYGKCNAVPFIGELPWTPIREIDFVQPGELPLQLAFASNPANRG